MSADPEIARYFSGTLTPEQANVRIDRFKATIARAGFGFLAAQLRETGTFAGVICLSRIDETTRAAIPRIPKSKSAGLSLGTCGARVWRPRARAPAWPTLGKPWWQEGFKEEDFDATKRRISVNLRVLDNFDFGALPVEHLDGRHEW